jgi:hypothetical protein
MSGVVQADVSQARVDRRTTLGRVAFNVAGVAVGLLWLAAFGAAVAMPLGIASMCRTPAFSMWPDPVGTILSGLGAVGHVVLFVWGRRQVDLRRPRDFLLASFVLAAWALLRSGAFLVTLLLYAVACS